MASLAEIQAILTNIEADLPALIQRSQITPQQVVIVEGLSDISERLGLIQAGEFRSGNGLEPGFGFSGVRIGYPAFSYDSELWHIVGIEDDTLQVGIRASDGKIVFGGGDGFLDSVGLNFINQEGSINFQDATTGDYDNVQIYIDGSDDLVLRNAVGGSGADVTGIRFDIDTPAHAVVQYSFYHDAATFPGDLFLDGTLYYEGSLSAELGWFPQDHTWTRTGDHTFTVPNDVTSIYRKGTRIAYTEDAGDNEYGVVASSSYDGVGDITTINLIPNTDYTLSAGTTIADIVVSYIDNPSGFPLYFNWNSNPSGLTVGDGTLIAYWAADTEGFIDYEWMFALDGGGTSAVTGAVNITMPIASVNQGFRPVVGVVTYLDNGGAASYAGVVLDVTATDTTFRLRAFDNNTANYTIQAALSSTVPFTWGVNDAMYVTGRYPF